jgi:N-methylhydantoinase B
MMTSPSMTKRLMAQGGASQWPGATCSGVDQRGNTFGGFMLDPMGAGLGAFATRDGVDTGGIWFDAKGFMPNVEQVEHTMPILYVYRKEIPDSGGAGKYRGGNAGEWAFVAHKTDKVVHATSACGCAVPTAHGLSGGGPGAPNEYRIVHGSNVQELMERGEIPQDLADLEGRLESLLPKQVDIVQTRDDAYAIRWAGAAGFGDPLERDPERVARDVRNETVTPNMARSVYGVVLDGSEDVDLEATVELRRELTLERLAAAKPYDNAN